MTLIPQYIFENGLRKVKPYYNSFQTTVKRRWIGKTLLEVMTHDFGQLAEKIKAGIDQKSICVYENVGKRGGTNKVDGWENLKDRKMQHQDSIYNLQHIHEPSVSDGHELYPNSNLSSFKSQLKTDIQIIHEDDDILVVNKPSGIPTHPSGSFRYNSITEILKHDLFLDDIWLCHRLDKGTSGVLILGLNKEATNRMMKTISKKAENVNKSYVARVHGEFPVEGGMVNCPIFLISGSGNYINQTNADNLPINSTTIFERVSYNELLNESIVICKPLTGRMHQIRIHLRNIGHPIVNDEIYNPLLNNSSALVTRNAIELKLYGRIFETFPKFKLLQNIDESISRLDMCIDIFKLTNFHNDLEIQDDLKRLCDLRKYTINHQKEAHGEICAICNERLFNNNTLPTGLHFWLHAFKYELKDEHSSFEFETELPQWCNI